jgi:iron-sulfur cluster insertion protein
MNDLNLNQISVKILPKAIQKIKNVKNSQQNQQKFLRIGVDGGGCNGFQYLFNLDDKLNEDDIIIYQENQSIIAVTDKISEEFLKNSEIDFVEDLGSSEFKIKNPNASSSCGCGASFSV